MAVQQALRAVGREEMANRLADPTPAPAAITIAGVEAPPEVIELRKFKAKKARETEEALKAKEAREVSYNLFYSIS